MRHAPADATKRLPQLSMDHHLKPLSSALYVLVSHPLSSQQMLRQQQELQGPQSQPMQRTSTWTMWPTMLRSQQQRQQQQLWPWLTTTSSSRPTLCR